MRALCFWNKLDRVGSKSNDWKAKTIFEIDIYALINITLHVQLHR